MRLVTYDDGSGAQAGVLIGEQIVPAVRARRAGAIRARPARELDAGGLAGARCAAAAQHERLALAGVRLLAPVPDPQKIICLGLNYRDHAEETGQEITGGAAVVREVRQLADRQRRADRAARGAPGVRRLRGRAGRRDRPAAPPRERRRRARARRRRDAVQRRQRPRPAAAEPAVDERQGDRHVRALRPRARDARRGRRPRRTRPAHAHQRRASCRRATPRT